MFEKQEKINKLLSLSKYKLEDKYILDNENAVIVIENNDRTAHKEYYAMIHLRLIKGRLKEINRWYMNSYYFGSIHNVTVIQELNLFQVQNGGGDFNALYDYKNANFVVPRGIWHIIESGRGNNILKKYNGFLASFEIRSDYEEDNVFSYINPVTNKKIVQSFGVWDGKYYALLNIDGTIRGNKLFKGTEFSKITDIIDLDKYESLEQFKRIRKQMCNEQNQQQKRAYKQMIEKRNDGSISPYLDTEVAKILSLNK